MSFPNIIYGDYGDDKVTSSTRIGNLPLGTEMVLPDGREYVHAVAAAAALTPGTLNVQKAVAGTSVNVAVAVSAAIGDKSIVLTMPATTLCTVADQYKDGFLIVNDEVGEGYGYAIKSSNTAAAAATATIILQDRDGLKLAIIAGTSQVTIRESPYYGVLTRAAGTASVGIPVGVADTDVTASFYCWLRKRGTGALLASGTLAVAGRQFAAATVTAGGFEAHNPIPADTTLAPVAEALGYCEVAAAASTEYFIGNLQLP